MKTTTEPMKWATFTRRTNDPKLSWIEGQLFLAGIPYRRNGESFHAPRLEVPVHMVDEAWKILPAEIDDAPDDLHVFTEPGLPMARVIARCQAYLRLSTQHEQEQHDNERQAGEHAHE